MTESRKQLKISAIVVLIFAGLSLFKTAVELFFIEFDTTGMPEGTTETTILITKIILAAVFVLLTIPHVYVGVKGLTIAKNPSSYKGHAHIVWAIILLVFAALSVISPMIRLINKVSIYDNISMLLGTLVEVLVFSEYIKYAKEVSKAA